VRVQQLVGHALHLRVGAGIGSRRLHGTIVDDFPVARSAESLGQHGDAERVMVRAVVTQ
jgi:hypothetical protein